MWMVQVWLAGFVLIGVSGFVACFVHSAMAHPKDRKRLKEYVGIVAMSFFAGMLWPALIAAIFLTLLWGLLRGIANRWREPKSS